jgi:hypothetical protein
VTAAITALVHLIWLNITFLQEYGSPDLLFTLNGLGYLGLLAIFLTKPDFLADQWEFFHYIFMAYAAVTILAFFLLGSFSDIVGWFTKVDELVLIVALWMNLRSETKAETA